MSVGWMGGDHFGITLKDTQSQGHMRDTATVRLSVQKVSMLYSYGSTKPYLTAGNWVWFNVCVPRYALVLDSWRYITGTARKIAERPKASIGI